MQIKKLSSEVQTALRTGIVISGTTQCITELVENSLDAQSTCIAVSVNLEKFILQVVDNGHGLSKEDLDLIGSRYITSKCHSLKDLKTNLKYYGFRGEALASLRQVCKVLMIVSRPKGSKQTYSKVFRGNQKSNAATNAAQSRLSVGTTVIVKDFLFNFPVRRDRIQPVMEIEDIRQTLIALSIMNYKVSFTLRNDVTKVVHLQTQEFRKPVDALKHHCSMKVDHCLVSHSTVVKPFQVSAHISRNTEPTGQFQFIYVNKRLVRNKTLHKIVSDNLSNSFHLRNIGKEGNAMNEKFKEYPVYIINIKCPRGEYDITSDPRKCQVEFKNWDLVINCLEETIKQFVLSEGDLNNLKDPASVRVAEAEPDKQSLEANKKQDVDEYPITSNVLRGAPVTRLVIPKVPIYKNKLTNSIKSNAKKSTCSKKLEEIDDNHRYDNKEVNSVTNALKVAPAQTRLEDGKSLSPCSYNSQSKHKRKYNGSVNESDMENPLPFKVPTQKHFAKKRKVLSEHITTENDESDATPIKQKTSGSRAISIFENKNKTSILPIVSEEFFNNAIKNNLLTTNILFKSCKISVNNTPTQAFQINMYRSVKEDRKNNFLKYIQENSVQYMDTNNDNSFYFNCYEGTESISKKHNELTPTSQEQLSNTPSIAVMDQYQSNIVKSVAGEQPNTSSFRRNEHFKQNWKLFSPIFKHLTAQSLNKCKTNFFYSNKIKNITFEKKLLHDDGKKRNLKRPHTSITLGKHNRLDGNAFCSTKREIEQMYSTSSFSKRSQYQRISIEKIKNKTKGKSIKTFKPGETEPCTMHHVSKDGEISDFSTQNVLYKKERSFHGNKCSIFNNNMTDCSTSKVYNNDHNDTQINTSLCESKTKRSPYNKTLLTGHSLVYRDDNKTKFEPLFTELSNHRYSLTETALERSDNLFANNELAKEIQINDFQTSNGNLLTQKEVHRNEDISPNDNNFILHKNSHIVHNKEWSKMNKKTLNIKTNTDYKGISFIPNFDNNIKIGDSNITANQEIPTANTESNFNENYLNVPLLDLSVRNMPDNKLNATSDHIYSFKNDQSVSEIQTPNCDQYNEIENKENSETFQISPTIINFSEANEIEILASTTSPLEVNNLPKNKLSIYSPLKDTEIIDAPLNDVQFNNSTSTNVQTYNLRSEEVPAINNLDYDQKENTTNTSVLNYDVNIYDEGLNDSSQTNKIHVNSQRWNLEMTPNGRIIYIHRLTGMSSFHAPIGDDGTPYTLHNRHWFMTKGASPLLQINDCKENVKQLSDVEKNVLQDIIVSNVAVELETVKWKFGKAQEVEGIVNFLDAPGSNVKTSSHLGLSKPCVFSVESLLNAKVLGQVDCKFIAAILQPSKKTTSFLILFDQHAVDERIHLENLLSRYKEKDGQLVMQPVNPSVEIFLDERETNMIAELQPRLLRMGFQLKVDSRKVSVSGIPMCLFNRVIKQNGDDLSGNVISAFVRQLIISAEHHRGIMPSLPKCLSDIINSEACRGAVKFGDNLTLAKCKHMIAKLALCEMPFQCAHGRPVLTPLTELQEPASVVKPINLRRLMRKQ